MAPDTRLGEAAIVGREREQAILRAQLAAVVDSGPALVVVTGEAGIGKSTLLDQFAREARADGVRVIRGEADEVPSAAQGLWIGPRRHLGVAPPDAAELPDERRWASLDELAEALSGSQRTLVVLDDVHRADADSRWILERLPAAVAGPVLFLAGTRDASSEPEARMLRAGAVVSLAGLSLDEVAALVARTDPSREDLDAEVLLHRTGGNPFFVREVATAPRSVEIPYEVGFLLERTLARLPATTQQALAVLAIAGEDAPPAVVAGALGTAVVDVDDRLDAAVSASVLVAGRSGGVRFRHDLLRDAAVQRLDPTQRRRLHLAVAASWDAVGVGIGAVARSAAARLASVPEVDAAEAADRAAVAATTLAATGDLVGASRLLTDALAVIERFAPGAIAHRAEIRLQLGEALDATGDRARAAAIFAAAATDASQVVDPVLSASAELGVDRHRSMHDSDPERLVRLRTAEASLPPGDHVVRAGLLGRIGVALAARTGLRREAATAGAEAVAMARRSGDPGLLVDVLIDQHLSPRTPEELRSRTATAAELAALAGPASRPDLIQVSAEWEFSGALLDGDLARADDACTRLEVAAAVAPTRGYRFAATMRRASLATVAGQRERARDLAGTLRSLGSGVVPDQEALSIEEGLRSIIVLQTGRPDERVADLHRELKNAPFPPDAPFFRIHVAMTDLVLGEVEAAERLVRRWAPVVTDPATGAEVPSTVANLAWLVGELGLADLAPSARRSLEPFSGMVGLEYALIFFLPVDTLIARLARLGGDLPGAVRHAQLGLDLVRDAGSPVWTAWASWFLAESLDGSGDRAGAARARADALEAAARAGVELPAGDRPMAGERPVAHVIRTPIGWQIETPIGSGVVGASRGLDQLIRVLTSAPAEVAAVDLTGSPGAPVDADLGPVLDATAKRAYRRRIAELEDEIAVADRVGDPQRSTQAQFELDAIFAELRRAIGLGGRDRPNSSGAERARVNVTRSIRRAIDAVRAAMPELGAHLEVSVRTGGACAYRPDPAAALRWIVEDPPG